MCRRTLSDFEHSNRRAVPILVDLVNHTPVHRLGLDSPEPALHGRSLAFVADPMNEISSQPSKHIATALTGFLLA